MKSSSRNYVHLVFVMLDDFMEIIGCYIVITALTIIVLLNSNISSGKF